MRLIRSALRWLLCLAFIHPSGWHPVKNTWGMEDVRNRVCLQCGREWLEEPPRLEVWRAMRKGERVLSALATGATLRFIDYGSGAQRVCYCQLVSAEGEPGEVFSKQVLYLLRKRGAIVFVRSAGAFEYYGLPPAAQ